jgi:hypothetical protein
MKNFYYIFYLLLKEKKNKSKAYLSADILPKRKVKKWGNNKVYTINNMSEGEKK